MKMKDNKEIIYMDYCCPLCGGKTYTYNNPEDDETDGVYCEHDECPWFRNQFISYEDIY